MLRASLILVVLIAPFVGRAQQEAQHDTLGRTRVGLTVSYARYGYHVLLRRAAIEPRNAIWGARLDMPLALPSFGIAYRDRHHNEHQLTLGYRSRKIKGFDENGLYYGTSSIYDLVFRYSFYYQLLSEHHATGPSFALQAGMEVTCGKHRYSSEGGGQESPGFHEVYDANCTLSLLRPGLRVVLWSEHFRLSGGVQLNVLGRVDGQYAYRFQDHNGFEPPPEPFISEGSLHEWMGLPYFTRNSAQFSIEAGAAYFF